MKKIKDSLESLLNKEDINYIQKNNLINHTRNIEFHDPSVSQSTISDSDLINKANKSLLKKIYNNIHVVTIIALFFTLFGTILGGIWADQSWGRFWGWDPKENGALLIVLWHLMMLHLRISGLVGKIGYTYGVSLVNIIVALAWFGVNLLNVGLHSYGFTDNVATNLFLFISFEIIFMTTMYFLAKRKILNLKV